MIDTPSHVPSANPSNHQSAAQGASPLWLVLLFTFANSLGSAVLNAGIYFLAENRFEFSNLENYGLGLLYGLTYIPAAMAVGPLLRRLPAGSTWANPRGVLVVIMLLMAAACMLPVLVPRAWTVWALVGIYSPLSGMLWPIVESYVSGGRSGKVLRSAIGKFNVAWSSALVIAMFAMSPFVKTRPLDVLTALAAVQVFSACILVLFRRTPGSHGHEAHTQHPPVYTQLLRFLQVLLPVAFMFLAALGPSLPGAGRALGLRPEYGPLLPAIWMAARVLTFCTLERWDGWHGRWWTPMLGVGCLLAGFAAAALTPRLMAGTPLSVPAVIVGLAVFGIGVGIVYCSALYYAMEVGSADVDAGGTHEMLIGIGYSVGPACGLIGALASSRGGEEITVIAVSILALAATMWSLRRAQSALASARISPT